MIAPGSLSALFEEGVPRALPHYEPRAAQRTMAEAVADAIDAGRALLVEAPTGVGKSLAYLLPAALHAIETSEPVLVSTYTKALEDQLLADDIPLVRRALGRSLDVAVVRGRANYLCLARWNALCGDADGAALRRSLEPWVESTPTGYFGELTGHAGRELHALSADVSPAVCHVCSLNSVCHLFAARRAAQRAQIVIVNHALLLSDVAVGGGILPAAPVLIADEAHRLPEVARTVWQVSVSAHGIEPLVRAFAGEGRPGSGLSAMRRLGRGSESLAARATAIQLGESAASAMREALRRVRDLAHALEHALTRAGVDVSPENARVRLRPSGAGRVLAGPADRAVEIAYPADEALHVAESLHEVTQALRRVQDALEDVPQDAGAEAAAAEIGSSLDAWSRVHDAARASLTGGDVTQVQWVERTPGSDALALASAPRDVATRLGEAFSARHRTVVCTSATLAPAGDFAYPIAQLGLRAWSVRTAALASPFPLAQQLLVCTARDVPPCGTREHEHAVASVVLDVQRRTGRNILVLCTSLAMVRAVSARVRLAARAEGWPLFVQGEDGVPRVVVERFRAERGAVLVGTASLWEGIDLPGPECEVVVITRLPFPVPTDPVVESETEAIEADGGDAFRQLHVPQAQLRLVQGVGRVIRRASDRGAVIVADARLVTRSYGLILRQGLPVPVHVSGTLAELAADVSEWCAGVEEEWVR